MDIAQEYNKAVYSRIADIEKKMDVEIDAKRISNNMEEAIGCLDDLLSPESPLHRILYNGEDPRFSVADDLQKGLQNENPTTLDAVLVTQGTSLLQILAEVDQYVRQAAGPKCQMNRNIIGAMHELGCRLVQLGKYAQKKTKEKTTPFINNPWMTRGSAENAFEYFLFDYELFRHGLGRQGYNLPAASTFRSAVLNSHHRYETVSELVKTHR